MVSNRPGPVGGTLNTINVAANITAFQTTPPRESNASNIEEIANSFQSIFNLPNAMNIK